MQNKRGITLIALVVTIIVMMVLAGIVIAVLNTDDNFISKALGTKKENVEGSIKEYVLSSYTQVITNPDLDRDPIDVLEERIMLENEDKKEEEKFIIKSIDKTNNKIFVEHQGIEVEIELDVKKESSLEFSSEETQQKKYTVKFEYKDENNIDQILTMHINSNQTIQNYLNSSQESIPENKEWEPTLDLNSPVLSNRIYKEKFGNVTMYTVSFNLDGGNIGGQTSIPAFEIEEGSVISNPGIPVKTHYNFAGWLPSLITPITKDTNFTAQWTPVTYTFTYNLDGGSIGGSSANRIISGQYNTPSSTPGTPTKAHHTFSGWSPTVPATFDQNRTFTAQWSTIQYSFNFKLNGGKRGNSTLDFSVMGAYGSPVPAITPPTKNNHTFDGWSPAVPATFDQNRTFEAQWSLVKYVITYNLDGGNIGGSTTNQTRLVEHGSMPPDLTPVKTGNVLIGWTPTLVVATKNTIYTAIWSIPMEIQMRKASINEGILIPIDFNAGQFALISNAGGAYIEYNTKNPVLTNNVAANTAFSIKILGRIKEFSYDKRPAINKAQIYRIIAWGEVGAQKLQFSGTNPSESFITNCPNLTGPIPSPSPNSFSNINWGMSALFYNSNITGSIPADFFTGCYSHKSFDYIFNGCKNLTGSIPSNLFENCSSALSFYLIFADCTGLIGSIPGTLFSNCTKVINFHDTFSYCTNLTGPIPGTLFSNCPEVTIINAVFNTCSSLTGSIPDTLFSNCPNITTLSYVFYSCNNLTGAIPATLFSNCTKATNFMMTFAKCSNLTGSIPDTLFSNCPNITSLSHVFSSCSNLTGPIPSTLFSNCTKVINFDDTFSYCTNLTGPIPGTLFSNCTEAISFEGLFVECTSLTGSIPATLFSNCHNITNLSHVFFDCSNLTGAIPATLFSNCPNITSFHNTFYRCVKLTGNIPTTLFSNCTKVVSFHGTFHQCVSLTGNITASMFSTCQEVEDFGWTFASCFNLQGTAPSLWLRSGITNSIYCFKDCTKLSNYSTIPATWK